MISDSDIGKLCYGRIVYGNLESSAGVNDIEPHYAIMIDSTESIKEQDEFYVVGISHNTTIDDTFIIPVPPKYDPIEGHAICSWVPFLPLPGIIEVTKMTYGATEMMQIETMVRQAREHRRRQRRPRRK